MRWAIAASEHRSLRQAAAALNVRQSTLSRRLRDIEARIGASLFKRTNGGTRTTTVGQEFLDAARRIVEEVETIAIRLQSRARGDSGHLTIGIHASLSTGNLRATLMEYRHRFPQVEINLVDGSSDHLTSDVSNSVVDVAFIAGEGVRWPDKTLLVWSERAVVALPQDHVLCDREILRWDDLHGGPMLLPQRGPGRELFVLLMRKVGCSKPSDLIHHDVGLDRLLTLVGAGWGTLLALEGATATNFPGVTFREIHDADGPTRMNFRAIWRDASCNPSLGPFLSILRERHPAL